MSKTSLSLFFAFFLMGCQMPLTTQHVEGNTSPDATTLAAPLKADLSSQPTHEKETSSSYSYEYTGSTEKYSNKYTSGSAKLEQCKSQLDALKVMSPAKYSKMRNSFDYLMKGAAQYDTLREKINSDTQVAVDALYHYRANLLCAQIAHTLLDGLIQRGEARP